MYNYDKNGPIRSTYLGSLDQLGSRTRFRLVNVYRTCRLVHVYVDMLIRIVIDDRKGSLNPAR